MPGFIGVGYSEWEGADEQTPVLIKTTEDSGLYIRGSLGTWRRPTPVAGSPIAPDNAATVAWVFSAAIRRFNPAEMYAGTVNGEFFASEDGGTTWEERTSPFDDAILSMGVSDDNQVFVAVGGIRRSLDQGSSWTQIVGAPGGYTGVYVADSKIWYVVDGDVYHANFDGSLQSLIGVGTANLVISASSDVNAVTAIRTPIPGKVYKHSATTATEITPFSFLGTVTEAWALTDSIFLLLTVVGTGASSVERIYRTVNAGTNWSLVHTFPIGEGPIRQGVYDYHHFASRYLDPSVVYVNGFASSTTGVRTWKSVDLGVTWSVEDWSTVLLQDEDGFYDLSGPGGLVAP